MIDIWLHERGSECYCPIELDKQGHITGVLVGMNLIQSEPPETTVGEFWYDENRNLQISIYPAYMGGDL